MHEIIREIRRQLSSRISWLVVALFLLAAGVAFVAHLNAFLAQSTTPSLLPDNVNQLLVRPFVVQIGMAAMLLLPFITARPANAGETPLIGQFGGVSLVLVGVLFFYGALDWGPIVSGYLGLSCAGAAFLAAALLCSSLAESARVARLANFALSLSLVAAAALARWGTEAARPVFRRISVGEFLDDFAKGVIDSSDAFLCVSVTVLALFLAAQVIHHRRRHG